MSVHLTAVCEVRGHRNDSRGQHRCFKSIFDCGLRCTGGCLNELNMLVVEEKEQEEEESLDAVKCLGVGGFKPGTFCIPTVLYFLPHTVGHV